MRKHFITWLISLCCCWPEAGLAGELALQPMNHHHGTYLEASLGTNVGFVAFASSLGIKTGGSIGGVSLHAAIGHMFRPYIGVEGGVVHNRDDNSDDIVTSPYVAGRFHVPLGERFNIITKLGAMAAFIEDDIIGLPFFGFGCSVALNDTIDISLQYQGLFAGIIGAGALGLGLTLHL